MEQAFYHPAKLFLQAGTKWATPLNEWPID
jgi:hypothetical protein